MGNEGLFVQQLIAPVYADQSHDEECEHQESVDSVVLLTGLLFTFQHAYVLAGLCDLKDHHENQYNRCNQEE